MIEPTRVEFPAVFPLLDEQELNAAHDRFKRYVRLAAAVSGNQTHPSEPPLTEAQTGGSVDAGKVDPTRTLTNTG
jgi:hypothetical protein